MDIENIAECLNLVLISRKSSFRCTARVYETSSFINGKSRIVHCEIVAGKGGEQRKPFLSESLLYKEEEDSKEKVMQHLEMKVLVAAFLKIGELL